MDRKSQLLEWIAEKPDDPFLNYALATEFVSEGNDAEAENIFSFLVINEPNYFATYYHYGQLLERIGQNDKAIVIYKKGMEICNSLDNKHAYSELRSVLEELEF
jgi:tetratricopeptide (TPR) repeat protein